MYDNYIIRVNFQSAGACRICPENVRSFRRAENQLFGTDVSWQPIKICLSMWVEKDPLRWRLVNQQGDTIVRTCVRCYCFMQNEIFACQLDCCPRNQFEIWKNVVCICFPSFFFSGWLDVKFGIHNIKLNIKSIESELGARKISEIIYCTNNGCNQKKSTIGSRKIRRIRDSKGSG